MTTLPATIDATPITDMVKDEVAQLRAELGTMAEVLSKNLGAAQADIVLLRHELDRLKAPPKPPAIAIDYSNGNQLAGLNVDAGNVQYHLQWPGGDYAVNAVRSELANVPDGGSMLWDTEPWRHSTKADYWEGSEENIRELFAAYAATLKVVLPILEKRNIIVHVYQAPVMLAKRFTVIRRPPGHRDFEGWKAQQNRVLELAHAVGFVDALRLAGGVALPLYTPDAWEDGRKWAVHMGVLMDNLSALLDEWDLPFVWLLRPDCAGKPLATEHLDVMLEKAKGQMAFWGTPSTPGWVELREALQ